MNPKAGRMTSEPLHCPIPFALMSILSAVSPYIRQAEDINDLQKWQGTQFPSIYVPPNSIIVINTPVIVSPDSIRAAHSL